MKADKASILIESDVVRESLPPTLFGFNMNFFEFQEDYIKQSSTSINKQLILALKPFQGALYRYPGGLVANTFDWEASTGPLFGRVARKSVKWAPAGKARFGVDEYLEFVKGNDGQPWYVLNLVGWDDELMHNELPSTQIAKKNKRLALHLKNNWPFPNKKRYYQLGNELDRSIYEWSTEKYIARCLDTIKAIQEVDPEAKFVAFLRDFDWHYKSRMGKSRFTDFIKDVLLALPMVNDISLHMYYDKYDKSGVRTDIVYRMERFMAALDVASLSRQGETPRLWITEHARAMSETQKKASVRHHLTSGLSGAISTADFLCVIAQLPHIYGACWHVLGGVYWKLLQEDNGQLYPTPVYHALSLLKRLNLPIVLKSYTSSPNFSDYEGGYDIRATAFTDKSGRKLGLWVVNRSSGQRLFDVQNKTFSETNVKVEHSYLAGQQEQDVDIMYHPQLVLNQVLTKSFSKSGVLLVILPPASISTFLIEPLL